jgi:hypothetical protein
LGQLFPDLCFPLFTVDLHDLELFLQDLEFIGLVFLGVRGADQVCQFLKPRLCSLLELFDGLSVVVQEALLHLFLLFELR